MLITSHVNHIPSSCVIQMPTDMMCTMIFPLPLFPPLHHISSTRNFSKHLSSVMENISLILPIFISPSLSHTFALVRISTKRLTLTRMHQAQENIKLVKRKSNGLRQFECGFYEEKKKLCIVIVIRRGGKKHKTVG